MSTTRIIEVIVSPQGVTTVQTQGFPGSACQAASRFLEAALGQVWREQRTGEFYQTEAARQTLPQNEGG
jgi:hypothetical protein